MGDQKLMDLTVSNKLDSFFSKFKAKKFSKGEVIIGASESPGGIYYVAEGSVRMYVISQKAEEATLNIYKKNAFFPISWVLNNTKNRFCYEAISEVKIFIAPKDRVLDFLKNEPEVLMDLVKRLSRGTDGMLLRMENLLGGSASSRLVTELVIYAKRFGRKERGGAVVIDTKVSEKELASLSGLARETVSRELKKLYEKGLIVVENNRFSIQNLKTLEEELVY